MYLHIMVINIRLTLYTHLHDVYNSDSGLPSAGRASGASPARPAVPARAAVPAAAAAPAAPLHAPHHRRLPQPRRNTAGTEAREETQERRLLRFLRDDGEAIG